MVPRNCSDKVRRDSQKAREWQLTRTDCNVSFEFDILTDNSFGVNGEFVASV
jgi:hypothetical protein